MIIKDLCFEIIQTCPNECIFCSSCAAIDKTKIISLELFKKTIDHFLSIGTIEEISISGGEPFLHPNLFEIISYCKSKQIRVVLFTSGVKRATIIDNKKIFEYFNTNYNDTPKEILDKITNKFTKYFNEIKFSSINKEELEHLKSIGLDKIVFDFQASDLETYQTLMGKNFFCETSRSIIAASCVGLTTDVHFIPNKINYKHFPDLIELLNIAEVNNLSILNFVPQGRGEINKNILMLNEREMEEFRNIFNKEKDKFNGTIRVGIPLTKKDKHLCTAGFDKIVIKYDGTVLPCPAFKEFDISILNSLGIKTPNIHDNLDKITIEQGSRKYPLCKKLYNFKSNLN